MPDAAPASSSAPWVFVVGAARSGTTWVTRSLRSTGRFVGTNESHLFPTFHPALVATTGRQRTEEVLRCYDERRERAGRMGHGGPQVWIERAELEAILTELEATTLTGDDASRHVIEAIFTRFLRSHRTPRNEMLLEKTPGHVRFADRILDWWPGALIVEVVRDGRDVCVSMQHKAGSRPWAPTERREQITRWATAVRAGRRVAARPAAAGRWHTVRYEDLHTRPDEELVRLLSFVGLPADPSDVARAREAASFASMRQTLRPDHIRKGEVGGWREVFGPDDHRVVENVAGDLLRELGYGP